MEKQRQKPAMEKLKWAFHIISLFLLCFTGVSSTEPWAIFDPNSTPNDYRLAVSVSNQDLHKVSSSVLMAETWLRNHVLTIYPSSKITHIVVGHNLLCFSKTHQNFHLILPTLINLHHSLTRWGLEREIKISPSLSSHCLTPNLSLNLIKPILHFIQMTNSTYLVNPNFDPLFLISPHLEFLKKIESFPQEKINLVIKPPKMEKFKLNPTMRKLSFVSALVGSTSFSPSPSPTQLPPPCKAAAEREEMWCVAKPSVPTEILQEAMDYACGEGGADCEEIKPNGNCYFPESVVAHASFAFNSYWQNTKNNGGTCTFGGTAMLINSDPSFFRCRFVAN